MPNETQLISKIAPRSVCGRIAKPSKPEALFHVYGVASGFMSGESTYGPWECLTGNFEAVNLQTDEVFQSPRAFLPRVAHGMIVAQFKQGKEGVAVRFALEVGIKPADTSVGYEYTVAPLVKPEEDDALMELRQEVKTHGARLEGPKKKA